MGIQIDASSLNTSALRLSVVGDNISNSSRSGFVGSDFNSVLADQATDGQFNGVTTQGGLHQFNQGAISSSNNSLDMAIGGQGFFRLSRKDDGAAVYTRDGSFELDKGGNLVNPQGDILQGYALDANGVLNTSVIQDLKIDTGKTSFNPTQSLVMSSILDNRSSLPTKTFNPADASTYNAVSTDRVYDLSGKEHVFESYYVKTSPNQWNLYTTTDSVSTSSAIVPPNTVATPQPVASLQFSQDGNLDGVAVWPINTAATGPTVFNPVTPGPLNIVIPGASGAGNVNLDISNTHLYAADSSFSSQQDGYGIGDFVNVTVGKNGDLNVNYSNLQTVVEGRVLLANFRSPTHLADDGNHQFLETAASGAPTMNAPGVGGVGSIFGSSIESANVDIANEMIKLIAAQRAYQVNSEAIQRQDETLKTTIDLIR
jgi:flagellar hook protein FlgE